MWQAGGSQWNQLNDLLQYLGHLAFRTPTPTYKHSAAVFLCERGWRPNSASHPDSPKRGDADRELLCQVAQSLDEAQ